MTRRFRFYQTGNGWTPWLTDNDDLSFLKNNASLMSMEVQEDMTKEQAVKQFPELFDVPE